MTSNEQFDVPDVPGEDVVVIPGAELLGATNGVGPTYLVLDHCMDLGITGISQIEVGPLTDVTYRFTRG